MMAASRLTDSLTVREVAIVRLIAQGYSSSRIAEALQLRTNTVMWYRKRLYLKLDVHSIAELIVTATREGII